MNIRKFAKINHISVNTLRLYVQWGLLTPSYVDQGTNYRYYTMRQNARLNKITYMKKLGMSLKEIKEVLDQEELNLIEAVLIKKEERLIRSYLILKGKRETLAEQSILLKDIGNLPLRQNLNQDVIWHMLKEPNAEASRASQMNCRMSTRADSILFGWYIRTRLLFLGELTSCRS